jgi:hypothetical protein
VPKPLSTHGIGVDVMSILKKPHFDGNDLGKLGNIEALKKRS